MKSKSKKYIETKYNGYSRFEFTDDYNNQGSIIYKGEVCFGHWNSGGDLIFHRPIGPTMIKNSGRVFWYKNLFVKHRKDGPSILVEDKSIKWYFESQYYYMSEEKYWNC